MNQIRMQWLPILFALALTSGISAQNEGPIELGRGAPRDTLAYMVMQPQVFTDVFDKFVAPQIKEEAEAYAKMYEEADEDQRSWMSKPGDPETAQWGLDLMNFFLEWPKAATRIDIALIDVLMGVPKVYIDMTLKPGAEVNLKPDMLAEMIDIAPVEMEGLQVHRYLMKDPEARENVPPIFAFTHEGHLYLSVYDSVTTALIRGLLTAPKDGDTLAENSNFKEWHASRTPHTLEIWINAREFRGWVERAEGLLGAEGQSLFREIDEKYINLRLWSQMIVNLDIDDAKRLMGLEFTIQTRREHEFLKKMALPVADHELTRMMPASTLMAHAGHFGDLNDLFGRVRQEISDVAKKMKEMEEANRKKWESLPESMPEPMPGDEARPEDDKQGMDDDDDEAKEGDIVDEFIDNINEMLSPVGLDFHSALNLFTGSYLVGLNAPRPGHDVNPGYSAPLFMVLGIREMGPVQEALNNYFKEMQSREDGMGLAIIEHNGLQIFSFEGAFVHVADKALVIVHNAENPDFALETLDECLAGNGQASAVGSALKGQSSMTFALDGHALMRTVEAAATKRERSLRPYVSPNFEPVLSKHFEDLMVVSNLSVTATSLTFQVNARGGTIEGFVNMAKDSMGGSWDNPEFKAFDKNGTFLRDLAGKLRDNYSDEETGTLKLPKTIDELLADGKVRPAHFQSLNDPKFEGRQTIIDSWFWSLDELDESVAELLKANESKGFVSYTMNPNAKFEPWTAHILFYETDANTHGGRMVMYTTGDVSWLHNDVWERAKKFMAAGKPIPQGDWDDVDDPQEEGTEGDKDGIRDDQMSAEQRKKVAQNIIDLYTKGALQAPSSFALHPKARTGQSATYTTTNLADQSARRNTMTVIDATATTVVVEILAPEGYVLAYRCKLPALQGRNHQVSEAWIGLAAGAARAITVEEPPQTPTEAAPSPYTLVTAPFAGMSLAGQTFDGTHTTYATPETGALVYETWTSDTAWFHGLIKTRSVDRSVMELTATRDRVKASLRYPVVVSVKEKKK